MTYYRLASPILLALALGALSCGPQIEWEGSEEEYEEAMLRQGLKKGTPGAQIGDANYCDDPNNLCDVGEGDCDLSTQCLGELVCGQNIGDRFGFSAGLDICVPSHCLNNTFDGDEVGIDCGGSCGSCPQTNPYPNGHPNHCSQPELFPCGVGEGDCNVDSQCLGALVCGQNIGDRFGFSAGLDICVPSHCLNNTFDGDEVGVDCGGSCGSCPQTNPYPNGHPKRCSQPELFPCGAGEGDCNVDSQCEGALVCGQNIGSQFGFRAGLDICVKAHCRNRTVDGDETGIDCGGSCGVCPPTNPYGNGHPLHCAAPMQYPCQEGEGPCRSNADCGDGFKCKNNSGAPYGLPAGTSVCVPATIDCTNGIFDGDEDGVDCGGSCAQSCLTPTPQLQSGSYHSCVLGQNNVVECWGYNNYGELGDGSLNDSAVPVFTSGLVEPVSLSAGLYHTCALLSHGEVACWGANGLGRLGDGTTQDRALPVMALNVTDAKGIIAGATHTCALHSNGTVSCWGSNRYGQLGDGTTINRSVAVPVTGLTDVVSLSAGLSHTCARRANGTVFCWGRNVFGQLGDGSTVEQRTTPVAVSSLSSVVALTSGNNHNCALLQNGTARCWGNNTHGQLGDGTLTASNVPVTVSALSGVSSLDAGSSHTCAVMGNGNVRCWGRNIFGQLGDGTTAPRSTSVRVTGLTNAQRVSLGDFHSCAYFTGGAVRCWGLNNFGQLGDGTTTDRLTPVQVSSLP